MKPRQSIVMLGTALDTKGGISAVINVYRQGGVFDRWPVVYIATHTDRGSWQKLAIAAVAFVRFCCLVLLRRVALVHVHTASAASFWRKAMFMSVAFLARCPVVLHLHGGGFIEFYQQDCGRIRQALVRFFFAQAAQIVVLSPEWKSKLGIITPRADIVPIFNPVQVKAQPTSENREAHTLLFLGRLHAEKGIFDLLAAIAELRREIPTVRLLCGGDGDLAGVKSRIEALCLGDAVQLLGWIGEEAKARTLATAAIYVLPSYYEGVPMGVLEAMAVGLPVVATVVGGIPEVVTDGVDGNLIQPGDVQALVVALRRLLQDADLRARMGAAGMTKIRSRFAVPVILPQIESVYRTLGAVPS